MCFGSNDEIGVRGSHLLDGPFRGAGLQVVALARRRRLEKLTNGHTVLTTTGGSMLGEVVAVDNDSEPRRRLCHYAAPDGLVIDVSAISRTPATMSTCCSS